MTEQAVFDTSMQSIQNVSNYTKEEHFNERTIIENNGRLEYLKSAWNSFMPAHNALVQRFLNENNLTEVDNCKEKFNELEKIFLETSAVLEKQIQDAMKIQENNELSAHGSDEEQEDNLHNQRILEQNQADGQEQNEQGDRNLAPPMLLPQNEQFGLLLQRMCNGVSSKKENTWGYFHGDLAKWPNFRDAFKVAVHEDELIKPVFKFQLLKSSLKGRAAAAFGEWQINEQNYSEAWNWLNELYEREYQTSKQILWKLLNFHKIERASGFILEKLVNVVQGTIRQLKAMGYPVEHYDLIFVHTIHEKLDPETSKDWELHRKSEKPTTKEMLDFLIQHGRALSSAQFHEQKTKAKRPSSDIEPKFGQKRAKFGTTFDSSKTEKKSEAKPNPNSNNRQCKLCQENHPLYKCAKFLKLDLKSRNSKVRELELCFNCLSPSHKSNLCPKDPCRRCEAKHNSSLCKENPLNRAVNVVKNENVHTKKGGNFKRNFVKGKKSDDKSK